MLMAVRKFDTFVLGRPHCWRDDASNECFETTLAIGS